MQILARINDGPSSHFTACKEPAAALESRFRCCARHETRLSHAGIGAPRRSGRDGFPLATLQPHEPTAQPLDLAF